MRDPPDGHEFLCNDGRLKSVGDQLNGKSLHALSGSVKHLCTSSAHLAACLAMALRMVANARSGEIGAHSSVSEGGGLFLGRRVIGPGARLNGRFDHNDSRLLMQRVRARIDALKAMALT